MKYKELIKMLERLRDSNGIKFQTARTRITAIRKVFDVMDEYSDKNLFEIDLDALSEQFYERYKDEVSMPTIATYMSRIKSSIEMARGINDIEREINNYNIINKSAGTISPIEIQLRGNTFVKVSGLPTDFKTNELDRIVKVLSAYCEN